MYPRNKCRLGRGRTLASCESYKLCDLLLSASPPNCSTKTTRPLNPRSLRSLFQIDFQRFYIFQHRTSIYVCRQRTTLVIFRVKFGTSLLSQRPSPPSTSPRPLLLFARIYAQYKTMYTYRDRNMNGK